MLTLASASPRRAALLREAGVEIRIAPTDVDEAHRPGETPVDYAGRVAMAKHSACPDAGLILAADTVVWIDADEAPLQKPDGPERARAMLASLISAGVHHVTTAFVLGPHHAPRSQAVTTKVWFRALSEHEIETHLASEDWRDKAGGYGIQSGAAGWVPRIEGSYTNVVGLPLSQVLEALVAIDPQ
jgi:septum formation protein